MKTIQIEEKLNTLTGKLIERIDKLIESYEANLRFLELTKQSLHSNDSEFMAKKHSFDIDREGTIEGVFCPITQDMQDWNKRDEEGAPTGEWICTGCKTDLNSYLDGLDAKAQLEMNDNEE